MFEIGTGEVIILLFVVLIFLGPKRIPDVARMLGRALREFHRAKDEIKEGILRESRADEISEIKKAFQFHEEGNPEKDTPPPKEP